MRSVRRLLAMRKNMFRPVPSDPVAARWDQLSLFERTYYTWPEEETGIFRDLRDYEMAHYGYER